jgi:protein-S-isoprenylcysteine O-methyltransferase Ste14
VRILASVFAPVSAAETAAHAARRTQVCYGLSMGFAIGPLALLITGAGLEVWSGMELGWRRALGLTDDPPDPALPYLVFRGPYRWVRHPQLLGLVLIVGAAVLARPGRVSGAAALLVVLGGVVSVRREERRLAKRAGEVYARYRAAVPAVWPGWRPA